MFTTSRPCLKTFTFSAFFKSIKISLKFTLIKFEFPTYIIPIPIIHIIYID